MGQSSRRSFLAASLAVGASLAAGAGLPRQARAGNNPGGAAPDGGGKKILILGGTGFLGPATVDAAQQRGHTLTLFNRGRTEKRKGGMYPDLEKLYGNRDPEKRAEDDNPDSAKGLESIKGRSWDVVIDNSGYYPRHVRASAEMLAPNAQRYIYISSISAYAANDKPDQDETAARATLVDPNVETMGAQMENYGGLKAACEMAVEAAFKERAVIVRPGYIVGPGDPTDRFTYWPVRADRGGEMPIPGVPEDPVQFIDVRDLGEWLVRLAETGEAGAYNAVGPVKPARWGEVVEACVASASTKPTPVWMPLDFVEQNMPQGAGFPIWIAPKGEYTGFHRWSNARAIATGLKSRPTLDVVKDTLAWFKTLPADRQAGLRAGLNPEQERELLQKWHAR